MAVTKIHNSQRPEAKLAGKSLKIGDDSEMNRVGGGLSKSLSLRLPILF